MLSRRAFTASLAASAAPAPRPNILLLLADNWAFPHASAYGDKSVRTPVFDRLAREGRLYTHAFAPNPSCSPSRSMLLTGQETHRLGPAANLYGPLDPALPTYTALLEKAGYFVGYSGKGWGPGEAKTNPAGRAFPDFEAFLKARPAGQPFCFWFGSHDPHVPWTRGDRAAIPAASLSIPPHLPDCPEVRADLQGYYAEVAQFDRECGDLLAALDRAGESPRTLVAMTGDNGWQLPRGLANCYDTGTRVPFAVRWGRRLTAGRVRPEFISLTDLAPTFLELAGVPVQPEMTGRGFADLILNRPDAGRRDAVFLERERHANVRRGDLSYPVRGIRTRDHLYLWNLRPDRWPAGDPELYHSVGPYGDVDLSPLKDLLVQGAARPDLAPYRAWALARRPAEELYDLRADPEQLMNLAGDERHVAIREALSAELLERLRLAGDPRLEEDCPFERSPFTDPAPRR